MMAPVRDTRTEGAHEDCVCHTTPWWEHPASMLPKNKKVLSINKDSTMKSDYQHHGSGMNRNTRFGAHRDRSPAVGAGLSEAMWQCCALITCFADFDSYDFDFTSYPASVTSYMC